jgi:type IV pilus assembly protein PilA
MQRNNIVGLLAGVALPAYKTYVVKARVVEGVAAMGSAKRAVTLYTQRFGALPPGGDNATAGFEQFINSTYIDSVDWHNEQRIEVEFNEDALGIEGQFEIQLEPQLNNGQIVSWLCGQDANVPEENYKYAPLECQTLRW